VTAPGLFAEPERVEIPDRIPLHWTQEEFRVGLSTSARIGDWEAVHRVVCAMIERGRLGPYGPLRHIGAALLDLHEPQRMYWDCRHHHEEDDQGRVPDGVFWLGGLEEYVCESGYAGTVCRSCDIDEDGSGPPEGTWPCSTFRCMAEKLLEALGVRL
jgi:hypothetical protein